MYMQVTFKEAHTEMFYIQSVRFCVSNIVFSKLKPGLVIHLGPPGPDPFVNSGGHLPTMGGRANKMASHRILCPKQISGRSR